MSNVWWISCWGLAVEYSLIRLSRSHVIVREVKGKPRSSRRWTKGSSICKQRHQPGCGMTVSKQSLTCMLCLPVPTDSVKRWRVVGRPSLLGVRIFPFLTFLFCAFVRLKKLRALVKRSKLTTHTHLCRPELCRQPLDVQNGIKRLDRPQLAG